MSNPVLDVAHLAAGYGDSTVVRDASLTVCAGEVVALLGANGVGKTTTLRAISGIAPVTDGTVTLAGAVLSELSPTARARRGMAHVPDNRGIFYGLTVAEHFRLRYRGERLDPEFAYKYFPALAEMSGRKAGLLSGGEQQMLAVGRALLRRPAVLLIDELSLGLAPIIVESLLPVIRAYADDSGCAVLLVEQHVHLALQFADRGYLMAGGVTTRSHDADELRRDRGLIQASYLGERAPDTSEGQRSDLQLTREDQR